MAISSSLALTSSYPFYVSGTNIVSFNAVAPTGSSSNSVIIGNGVGSIVGTGNSVIIGANSATNFSGVGNTNILIGTNVATSAISASSNIAMGSSALGSSNTPQSNIALGTSAGSTGTRIRANVIIGSSAGTGMTNVNDSIILGTNTGTTAARSSGSILIGQRSAQNITGSENIIIGRNAGRYSTTNYRSRNNIIIGNSIGLPENSNNKLNIGGVIFGSGVNFTQDETSGSAIVTGSLNGKIGINQWNPEYSLDVSGTFRVTDGMTGSLHGTSSWAENAVTASFLVGTVATASLALQSQYPFFVSGTTIASHDAYVAGGSAAGNFIAGVQAGQSMTNNYNSVIIGYQAGRFTSGLGNTQAIGELAGQSATNGYDSNFLGYAAGFAATNAYRANFIGNQAGFNAASANNSMFLGYQAGRATSTALSVGRNCIIIGTKVSLPAGTQDAMNIGGTLFGKNFYFNAGGDSVSGSVGGSIGINVVDPQYNLDISGSVRQQDGFTILSKVATDLNFANDTAAAAGGVPLGGLYRNGNVIQIRLV